MLILTTPDVGILFFFFVVTLNAADIEGIVRRWVVAGSLVEDDPEAG
jgi:hypothetical protein